MSLVQGLSSVGTNGLGAEWLVRVVMSKLMNSGLSNFMGFVDNNKYIQYCQTKTTICILFKSPYVRLNVVF